jgi:hypothetical protein
MKSTRWIIACAAFLLPMSVGYGQDAWSPTFPPLPQYPAPYSAAQSSEAPEPSELMVRQLTREALKMAAMLCRKGMYEQADYLLRRVQKLNPDDAEVRQALAAVHFLSNAGHAHHGEPARLPEVCDTPHSCGVVGPLPLSVGTTPAARPATGIGGFVSGPACFDAPLTLRADGCAIACQATKDCPCDAKTSCGKDGCCAKATAAAACNCAAAKCCAGASCKCEGTTACKCTAKCGCGDTCKCKTECGCGKACQCKGKSSVSHFPAAGHTVIWVIPSPASSTGRCPVINGSGCPVMPQAIQVIRPAPPVMPKAVHVIHPPLPVTTPAFEVFQPAPPVTLKAVQVIRPDMAPMVIYGTAATPAPITLKATRPVIAPAPPVPAPAPALKQTWACPPCSAKICSPVCCDAETRRVGHDVIVSCTPQSAVRCIQMLPAFSGAEENETPACTQAATTWFGKTLTESTPENGGKLPSKRYLLGYKGEFYFFLRRD